MDLRDVHLVFMICLVAYLYHCIRVMNDELKHKSSTIDALKQTQDDIVKEAEQQKFKLDEHRTKTSIITDDNLVLREKMLSNDHNIKTIDGTLVDLRRNLSSQKQLVESNVEYITVMRRHEMQMEKSIIRTKTENKQQFEDLKKTIARHQSDHNGIKDVQVETNKQLIQTQILLRNELLSLQKRVESTEVNIKTIEKDNLQRKRTILEMKTEMDRGLIDLFEKLAEELKDTFKQIIEQVKKVFTVTQRINVRIEKLEANRPHDTGIVWLIKEGITMLVKIAANFFLGRIDGYIE